MSELNQAVVASKSLTKMFKAFSLVGEVLDQIKNLQDYKVEAEVSAKRAKESLKKANASFKGVKEKLDELIAKNSLVSLEAGKIMKDTKEDVEMIIGEANNKATSIVGEARAWVANAKKEVVKKVDETKKTLDKLNKDRETLIQQVEVLKEEFAKLKRRLG